MLSIIKNELAIGQNKQRQYEIKKKNSSFAVEAYKIYI